MPDKVLTCQNCQNPFVYSEIEQQIDRKTNKPSPLYCPICNSILQSATKRPPKPQNSV